MKSWFTLLGNMRNITSSASASTDLRKSWGERRDESRDNDNLINSTNLLPRFLRQCPCQLVVLCVSWWSCGVCSCRLKRTSRYSPVHRRRWICMSLFGCGAGRCIRSVPASIVPLLNRYHCSETGTPLEALPCYTAARHQINVDRGTFCLFLCRRYCC
jgi:hypothetical protein